MIKYLLAHDASMQLVGVLTNGSNKIKVAIQQDESDTEQLENQIPLSQEIWQTFSWAGRICVSAINTYPISSADKILSTPQKRPTILRPLRHPACVHLVVLGCNQRNSSR